MAAYSLYRSPALPHQYPAAPSYGSPYPVYGRRTPTDAVPGYGQFQPNQVAGQPPRNGSLLGSNPTVTMPGYGSYGSGVNDATLAAGASYSGGGGGSGSLPPGAIPYDPFAGGNANIMAARGYRKQLINGQWVWLPPAQAGTQAPPSYFPN